MVRVILSRVLTLSKPRCSSSFLPTHLRRFTVRV
jgi:hypothetical protein